jgi:HEAT repeat protein
MVESTKRKSADPDDLASHLADLRNRDGVRREFAREAIVSLGRQAVDPLTKLLADPNHQIRWEAAKALSEIADPKSASALVSSLEDREFDIRWLSAIGLIAIGKDSLVPLLEALSRRSESVWLREGAHHVFHDLSKKGFMDLAAPILTALEGTEPGIEVQGPAKAALAKLRPKGWKRQKIV